MIEPYDAAVDSALERSENVEDRLDALCGGWQPAIIASAAHVAKLHTMNIGRVTCFAGEKIRVRENADADRALRSERKRQLGCSGRGVQVHPEDAKRLWPDDEPHERLSVCTCCLLMD